MKRSVAESVSGEVGGVAGAPMVRSSTWTRNDAHSVIEPSSAKRARRRKKEAESPRSWNRGCRYPVTFGDSADRKSTRLNSSHLVISYAVFCLKKKKLPSHSPLPRVRRPLQPQCRHISPW